MPPAILTTLLGGLLTAQPVPLENLDFHRGDLQGWEGKGFVLQEVAGSSPRAYAASSSDDLNPARKGMIRHVLVVPAHVDSIRFYAHPFCKDGEPDHRLDVVLAGEGDRLVPRKVRSETGWLPAPKLLPPAHGKAREYAWDVSAHSGKMLQIVLIDQDDRPDCFVHCSGFALLPAAVLPDTDFAEHMAKLQQQHRLSPMARFDSKRFSAVGNASEKLMIQNVRHCEKFYDLFYHHFQQKDFILVHPRQRLMLAIFDSPKGFEAYLGRKTSSGLTGMYHPGTNRLVLYDQNENLGYLAYKMKSLEQAGKLPQSADRIRYVEAVEKDHAQFVQSANLTAVMHEAAHLLSFNCGLLNRQGDVPLWLAEGLACYCETTDHGEWQALGAPNRSRIDELRRARGVWIPLAKLVKEDWRDDRLLLGYAQSWALFRMLIHERPKAVQTYLTQLHSRRTPDYRLDDFRQAFGPNLTSLERRYHDYLRDLAE